MNPLLVPRLLESFQANETVEYFIVRANDTEFHQAALDSRVEKKKGVVSSRFQVLYAI